MFNPSFFPLLTVITTVGISFAGAAEKDRKGEAKEEAPIPHYWDANSWEKDSGASFWHKQPTAPSSSIEENEPSTKTK